MYKNKPLPRRNQKDQGKKPFRSTEKRWYEYTFLVLVHQFASGTRNQQSALISMKPKNWLVSPIPMSYQNFIYLFYWENWTGKDVFIIIIWNSRYIVLLEPLMLSDPCDVDPLHRIWFKDSFKKVLCGRWKPLWDLTVSLENLYTNRAVWYSQDMVSKLL